MKTFPLYLGFVLAFVTMCACASPPYVVSADAPPAAANATLASCTRTAPCNLQDVLDSASNDTELLDIVLMSGDWTSVEPFRVTNVTRALRIGGGAGASASGGDLVAAAAVAAAVAAVDDCVVANFSLVAPVGVLSLEIHDCVFVNTTGEYNNGMSPRNLPLLAFNARTVPASLALRNVHFHGYATSTLVDWRIQSVDNSVQRFAHNFTAVNCSFLVTLDYGELPYPKPPRPVQAIAIRHESNVNGTTHHSVAINVHLSDIIIEGYVLYDSNFLVLPSFASDALNPIMPLFNVTLNKIAMRNMTAQEANPYALIDSRQTTQLFGESWVISNSSILGPIVRLQRSKTLLSNVHIANVDIHNSTINAELIYVVAIHLNFVVEDVMIRDTMMKSMYFSEVWANDFSQLRYNNITFTKSRAAEDFQEDFILCKLHMPTALWNGVPNSCSYTQVIVSDVHLYNAFTTDALLVFDDVTGVCDRVKQGRNATFTPLVHEFSALFVNSSIDSSPSLDLFRFYHNAEADGGGFFEVCNSSFRNLQSSRLLSFDVLPVASLFPVLLTNLFVHDCVFENIDSTHAIISPIHLNNSTASGEWDDISIKLLRFSVDLHGNVFRNCSSLFDINAIMTNFTVEQNLFKQNYGNNELNSSMFNITMNNNEFDGLDAVFLNVRAMPMEFVFVNITNYYPQNRTISVQDIVIQENNNSLYNCNFCIKDNGNLLSLFVQQLPANSFLVQSTGINAINSSLYSGLGAYIDIDETVMSWADLHNALLATEMQQQLLAVDSTWCGYGSVLATPAIRFVHSNITRRAVLPGRVTFAIRAVDAFNQEITSVSNATASVRQLRGDLAVKMTETDVNDRCMPIDDQGYTIGDGSRNTSICAFGPRAVEIVGSANSTALLEWKGEGDLEDSMQIEIIQLADCNAGYALKKSADGLLSCAQCTKGDYRLKSGDDCVGCPHSSALKFNGGRCATINDTDESFLVLPGFYVLSNEIIESCYWEHSFDACVGASCQTTCSLHTYSCDTDCFALPNERGFCKQGYIGRRCAGCSCTSERCYQRTDGGCVECPHRAFATIFLLVLVFGCLLLVSALHGLRLMSRKRVDQVRWLSSFSLIAVSFLLWIVRLTSSAPFFLAVASQFLLWLVDKSDTDKKYTRIDTIDATDRSDDGIPVIINSSHSVNDESAISENDDGFDAQTSFKMAVFYAQMWWALFRFPPESAFWRFLRDSGVPSTTSSIVNLSMPGVECFWSQLRPSSVDRLLFYALQPLFLIAVAWLVLFLRTHRFAICINKGEIEKTNNIAIKNEKEETDDDVGLEGNSCDLVAQESPLIRHNENAITDKAAIFDNGLDDASFWTRAAKISLLILSIVVFRVVSELAKYVIFERDVDGRAIVMHFPWLQTSEARQQMTFAIVGLVFYTTMYPIALFMLAWNSSRNASAAAQHRSAAPATFAELSSPYSSRFFYFESVIVVQKIALGVAIALPVSVKSACVVFVLLSMALLMYVTAPYLARKRNLHTTSMFLLLALWYSVQELAALSAPLMSAVFSWAVLSAHVIGCSVATVVTVRRVYARRRQYVVPLLRVMKPKKHKKADSNQ